MHIVYAIARGGGPEAYIKMLAPWLITQSHIVSVIYTQTKPFPSQMPEGVSVYFTKLRHGHYYLARVIGKYRLFAQQLRSLEISWEIEKTLEKIHRVHPIHLVELTEGHSSKSIGKKYPLVIRAHGSDWAFRDFCKDGNSSWDSALVREQAAQFSHAHIVSPLSKHYAEYLSNVCNLPRNIFEELPYPIDIDRFSPAPSTNADIAPNSLMTVGRLEHRKGSDIAVQAMNYVWESIEDAHLYLLGSEAEFTQKSLAGLADEKHRGQVVFPGFIEHGRLPSYYRAIKAYFAPTQYETLGYTILEAMACGVPVVTCPTGAVPELVEDGIHGKLVPFGDAQSAALAMVDLLNDDAKRKTMGANARQKALNYSLDIIGAKHIQMYEKARAVFEHVTPAKNNKGTP